MRCRALTKADTDAICAVMEESFGASEGPEEGALIATLARDLMTTTPPGDLHAFGAFDAGAPLAAIVFTRLSFEDDSREVFLLSPVAVHSAHQKRGFGQTLLQFGLQQLKDHGVQIAVTYGDPAYYQKVGFQQVSISQLAAPHPLSHPFGWQAQSLDGRDLTPLPGVSRCAAGLDNPAYW